MLDGWLTIEEAAKRVDRSVRTIYRWQQAGWITILMGSVSEAKLLDADRLARRLRGRPRKAQR